jgi:hypothetical protein
MLAITSPRWGDVRQGRMKSTCYVIFLSTFWRSAIWMSALERSALFLTRKKTLIMFFCKVFMFPWQTWASIALQSLIWMYSYKFYLFSAKVSFPRKRSLRRKHGTLWTFHNKSGSFLGPNHSVGSAATRKLRRSVQEVWKILLLFILTDPIFPANFSLFIFTAKILMPRYSAHLISIDPCLSYINRCTAHYSSVTFWIQFCLEQICKGYRSCSPCHHFHRRRRRRRRGHHCNAARYIWQKIYALSVPLRIEK